MFANRNSTVTRISVAVVIAATAYFTTNQSEAADGYVPFSGMKTAWHEGFDRYDFVMDDATGAITPMVAPAKSVGHVVQVPDGQARACQKRRLYRNEQRRCERVQLGRE